MPGELADGLAWLEMIMKLGMVAEEVQRMSVPGSALARTGLGAFIADIVWTSVNYPAWSSGIANLYEQCAHQSPEVLEQAAQALMAGVHAPEVAP